MSDLIASPKRTSELVVERMEQLIRSGAWPVGERIPAEPELVRSFGVGRNTIREAVRALEHAGLLAPRRGDGTYVKSDNPFAAVLGRTEHRELFDLLQVRRALESEAAASAARSATVDATKQMRRLLEAAEKAFATGELEAYDRADIAFHAGVVNGCGNALLVQIYAGVVEAMHKSHAEVTRALHSTQVHPPGHRALVEAIEHRDPDAARAAVDAYLTDAEEGARR
ncbi:MAG TPA: FCD domain-containing protein [Flexivirga sp.]|uniref:FadR/GntR family transcriptional regulator n=1 Tax=Flexivirga sp. TaxID=1962927 RepID=UPI002C576866|nr:FCD domain-containing protein [Flexivirga sp.]HWC21622.1 FCD domain-containing protein [Flexivirga sp.]